METKKPLEASIAEWVLKQGYPLEMEVAAAFQSCGFETTQSAYYEDLESGDTRETDVIAHQNIGCAKMLIRLSMIVECKKSAKDKPWILFSTGHDQLPSSTCIMQRASSLAGKKVLEALIKCKKLEGSPLLNMDENCGYTLTQACGDDNSDVVYKALMSVSKATASLAAYSDYYNKEHKKVVRINSTYANIFFPVVVTGGTLWRCLINPENHKLDLKQIGFSTLAWKNPLLGHHHTIIHVVSSTHIKAFVEYFSKTCNDIKTAIEGEVKADISAIPNMFVRRPGRVCSTIPI